MGMVIFSGSALTLLWSRFVKKPEVHDLVQRDKSIWPRCLLWHGWLPALAYPGGRFPWAETAEAIASHKLESAYGAHSAEVLREWNLSQRSLSASRASLYPNVWTDGSLVADEVVGTSSAGAVAYAHDSGSCWFLRSWGHLDMLPNDQELGGERCSLYSSLPGPLQSVQRAEMWGAVLALQATSAVHLGVDSLHVVRHVSRILACSPGIRPFELCVDGDLLSLIADLIRKRRSDTVQITKVKGHADDDMVRTGRVRALGKAGNDLADKAADFVVTGTRWCMIFIGILLPSPGWGSMRMVMVVPPHIPSCGIGRGNPKEGVCFRLSGSLHGYPGPPDLWRHGSVGWPDIHVDEADVAVWTNSAGMLVTLCAFLSSLHWPAVVGDLGVSGIFYVELLILYERWAGERLVLEPAVPRARRGSRPISVSAVPAGPSIDIWRSCRFLGSMLRAPGSVAWWS